MSENKEGKKPTSSPIPMAEWLVAALGFCIVLGTLVVLAVSLVRDGGGTAQLKVRVDSTLSSSGSTLVMFTVHNEGGQTAADVQVEGTAATVLGSSQRTVTIDFLSPRSAKSGVMVFEEAALGGAPVALGVVSYR